MHCKCKQANRAGCNRHKNGYPIYRSLTPAPSWATIPLPLQNQWLGFGRPNRVRRSKERLYQRFFYACYGGLRGDTFGCAGLLALRSTNPAQSASIFLVGVVADSQLRARV